MLRPVFARFCAGFMLAAAVSVTLPRAAEDIPLPLPASEQDTVPRAEIPETERPVIPDFTWDWPAHPRSIECREPLESVTGCWRNETLWVPLETGFPGLRTRALDLSGMEPLRVRPHFQPALAESPYGTGGGLPFKSRVGGPSVEEGWEPVQPLDTPVTQLHWMRGALDMNQFRLDLRRMVGNRAYLGLEYHSNSAESRFYDYLFNVHQPYLGAGRDSASMVIQDTSHHISTRHIRPRLGFWIDEGTVVELHADWFDNNSSLTNPTNPAGNDSLQRLYPASFSASAFGAQVAHARNDPAGIAVRAGFTHSVWERELRPRGDARHHEDASGMHDALILEATAHALNGAPRAILETEHAVHRRAFWTRGDARVDPDASARGDRQTLRLDAAPVADPVTFDVHGEAARRARADGTVEWLGGAHGTAVLGLPLGFRLEGLAGWAREGAPDAALFRWQPALGHYPNPGLTPRTHGRLGAGAGWESARFGAGARWEHHRFGDNWLPRVLPQPGACDALEAPGLYPGETIVCSTGGSLPDSVALALANYESETRELLHLSARGSLGNWTLTLRQTVLLANSIRDDRLGFTASNWQIPEAVTGGQLLWARRILDDRLGLRTQFDWDWISERYVFASDMDGTSRGMVLDEYLALDFTAQMEIRTFTLFFRAMNLYHDRYATEPGVHPPGVNFRFGVDWVLGN